VLGLADNFGGPGHVVEVGLAVEKDFCVRVFEAEVLDGGADLRG